MKWSETPQNMSFGSNGVDRVRSLRKILTQLRLENSCVKGTCSPRFASILMQQQNGLKRAKTCVLGPMEWIRCVRWEKIQRNFF
jgi:hypothetical protein